VPDPTGKHYRDLDPGATPNLSKSNSWAAKQFAFRAGVPVVDVVVSVIGASLLYLRSADAYIRVSKAFPWMQDRRPFAATALIWQKSVLLLRCNQESTFQEETFPSERNTLWQMESSGCDLRQHCAE
jgi:hypothetical protein